MRGGGDRPFPPSRRESFWLGAVTNDGGYNGYNAVVRGGKIRELSLTLGFQQRDIRLRRPSELRRRDSSPRVGLYYGVRVILVSE